MKKTNAYQQKLKSESGASLAAALLFFVVCAAAGSIIIAAAMSSAGRMSGITSADNQRYALESAQNFLEDTLLSDSGKTKSYYENESVIGGTCEKGSVNLEDEWNPTSLTDMGQILPAMADEVYQAYWDNENQEIQNSWPKKENDENPTGKTALTQSEAATAEPSISQNDRTDSQTTGGYWIPSGKVTVKHHPIFSSTMELTDSSGLAVTDSRGNKIMVTVKMEMHEDFSVSVKLTAENNGKNSQTVTDQFVLYPTISVDYESVLLQTGAGQVAKSGTDVYPSTENNKRLVHCEIQWLTVGEESRQGQSE